MIKTLDLDLEYMSTIPRPPQSKEAMYNQACSNDKTTVNAWRDRWVSNVKANFERYGDFKEKGIGKLYGKFSKQPAILVGSGPSLRYNVESLKDTQGIPIISCLHNYHYLHDHGVKADYFVSLDAGEVTIEEISEGGQKSHEEYVESTKDKTLIAYIGSHPKLLESWKGEILFFAVPVPDNKVMEEIANICQFHTYISTGGNVLGAATYIAKAIFGCNPLAFVGADFSFSYTKKFHAWDSKYDTHVGQAIRCVDVWGNKVLTWQSYYNFKVWFDWLACTVAGFYVNCTEGGLLGAYPEGNIQQIHQMSLKQFLWMYSMVDEMKEQCVNPLTHERKILF